MSSGLYLHSLWMIQAGWADTHTEMTQHGLYSFMPYHIPQCTCICNYICSMQCTASIVTTTALPSVKSCTWSSELWWDMLHTQQHPDLQCMKQSTCIPIAGASCEIHSWIGCWSYGGGRSPKCNLHKVHKSMSQDETFMLRNHNTGVAKQDWWGTFTLLGSLGCWWCTPPR